MPEQFMKPQVLRSALADRGLQLLGVGRHHSGPGMLVVYLHGNAGQWSGGTAQLLIASVPGVVGVTESPQSPTILLVQVAA